jgi:hypothetical protein
VRLYPTKEQRKILDDWFTDSQKVWNQAIHEIHQQKWLTITKEVKYKYRKGIARNIRKQHPCPSTQTYQMNRKRFQYNREIAEKKKLQRQKESKIYDIQSKYSCPLTKSAPWETLRKQFTLESLVVKKIKRTQQERKANRQWVKSRTPIDILQQTLRVLRSSFKSAYTNVLRGFNKHRYFRFKPKKSHYLPSSSDTITIPGRQTATKLIIYDSKDEKKICLPGSFQEWKTFRKRYLKKRQEKKISIEVEESARSFYGWKKEKLERRYKLSSDKMHLVTHIHPYVTKMSEPLAVHPFPYPFPALQHDYKILKRKGQFFLLVPFAQSEREVMQAQPQTKKVKTSDEKTVTSSELAPFIASPKKQVCIALDPGVNTFLSGYSPEGKAYQFGSKKSFKNKLQSILDRQDGVKSLINDLKSDPDYKEYYPTNKQKSHLQHCQQKWKRLENYKSNLVKDFHWKTAHFLGRECETLIIPSFQTKQMIKRLSEEGKKRSIRKKTARMLQTMSHNKFKLRLKESAKASGLTVWVGTEKYTSRTCGMNGSFDIQDRKTYSEIFTCEKCQVQVHRDLHSAMLIYNLNVTLEKEES